MLRETIVKGCHMRRGRSNREHRERLLRRRTGTTAVRKQVAQSKAVENKKEKLMRQRRKNAALRNRVFRRRDPRIMAQLDLSKSPAAHPLYIDKFKPYHEYKYEAHRPVVVAHAIDSLGLGGAQVMMMELFNALNKYYKDNIHNLFICTNRKMPKYDPKLYGSYGVEPQHAPTVELKKFCTDNHVDIVVHHRVSIAKDIHLSIPETVSYMIVNHTFHHMEKMSDFGHCDFYVSVCKFIHKKTKWLEHIDDSRKFVILNGVENDYVKDLKRAELDGEFKTGRCHRLVPSKFKLDSVRWFTKKLSKDIPGVKHFLIGSSSKAKELARDSKIVEYMGPITKRNKKMSIIKALDVYFYETFQHEGASIAILESLAAGIPVLCKPLGGCNELVTNGHNGFLVEDRSAFHIRMKELACNKNKLNLMRLNTVKDFDKRLHVRHAACKYMQIFEHVVKNRS